jgi:hypothetical protein
MKLHLLSALLILGCPKEAPDIQATDTGAPGEPIGGDPPEGPLEHQFSMVLVADPHVIGPGEHLDRLDAAVAWIEANREAMDLQLVVVLGDICWSEGFDEAHESLNQLSMPWVPVMGDNVIQTGGEATFHQTFEGQINHLEETLEGFEMAPTPVSNPEHGVESWLQNIAFDFGGIRFISADWSSRDIHTLWGETPDLHDFDGGTNESVILLSHMPLFEGLGGLTTDEATQAITLFDAHRDMVWANLAGHLHVNTSMDWERAGMEVHVTDATWDDVNAVRILDVSANEARFAFEHWIEEID